MPATTSSYDAVPYSVCAFAQTRPAAFSLVSQEQRHGPVATGGLVDAEASGAGGSTMVVAGGGVDDPQPASIGRSASFRAKAR